MFYERKIKYLDYYEGQERVKGSGFVKLEARDGTLRMEVAVTGLHHTDTFVREVMLCAKGRERLAGKIEISGGKGQYRQLWHNLKDIGDTGIDYGELQGIRIPLGAGREIVCRWPERGEPEREKPAEANGRRKVEKCAGQERLPGRSVGWQKLAGRSIWQKRLPEQTVQGKRLPGGSVGRKRLPGQGMERKRLCGRGVMEGQPRQVMGRKEQPRQDMGRKK